MLLPPPPPAAINPKRLLTVNLGAGCELYRVYDPMSRYRPGPRTFRYNGPRLRFDHQRAGTATPVNDPERGIYYAAFDLESAIVEVFGDSPRIIDRGSYRVARARLRDSILVLNLRGRGAMLAGTAAGLSGSNSRVLTQAWARYFYENPTVYGSVGGLLYANAHNGMDAIVLFERAEPAIARSTMWVRRLMMPTLEAELLRIANNNGLTLV